MKIGENSVKKSVERGKRKVFVIVAIPFIILIVQLFLTAMA